MAGLGQLPFAGPEPMGAPPYAQRLPLSPIAGVLGGSPGLGLPQNLTNAGFVGPANDQGAIAERDQSIRQQLRQASRELVWITHPSPLESKPILGSREQYTAVKVIAPATGSASAAATAGATALSQGAGQYTGVDPDILSPVTTAQYVTVLSFTVPKGRAFLIYSVAADAHDSAGIAYALRWQVRVGNNLVVPETTLSFSQLGAASNQLVVQELATEEATVFAQVRNLDVRSAALVNFYLLGWSFPLKGTGNTWEDLVDVQASEAPLGHAPLPAAEAYSAYNLGLGGAPPAAQIVGYAYGQGGMIPVYPGQERAALLGQLPGQVRIGYHRAQ